MTETVTVVVAAEFSDPEEGVTATVDRLVMAASHWKVSESALRSLIHLTALACASREVVSMTLLMSDINELTRRRLIRQEESGKVVLI